MGAKGATRILHWRELAADPTVATRLEADYQTMYANPDLAAQRGYVDDVIQPQETRQRLILGLEMARHKRVERPRRKHGNMPQ